MRRPGIEPGSQEWESCMIPLHQRRRLLSSSPEPVWLQPSGPRVIGKAAQECTERPQAVYRAAADSAIYTVSLTRSRKLRTSATVAWDVCVPWSELCVPWHKSSILWRVLFVSCQELCVSFFPVFTEPAPRQVQPVSCDVRLCVSVFVPSPLNF